MTNLRRRDRIVWIHAARNAAFFDDYYETLGDLPNFCVEVCNTGGPAAIIDDVETVEDYEAWLQEILPGGVSPIRRAMASG
jgi:hypothetical protein